MVKKAMRCASCDKLLAMTDGNTEIICPRCGAKNRFDPGPGRVVECEPKSGSKTPAGRPRQGGD